MSEIASTYVVGVHPVGQVARKPDVNHWQERFAKLKATYDASRTTDEYKNIWANADAYDADSANSKTVRHTLIHRSRYEIGNNGYSDGIAQTYATHLVGVGPVLRMQSMSEGFNRMVEANWHRWCKAINFRRKLWCMAHAKHSDGEGFAVIRRNPRVRNQILLDLCLYEAEQVQTPYLPFTEEGYIDGIRFDEFGNAQWYDILKQHPGTTRGMTVDFEPERVPADMVLHWFKLRRPGQHRGIPECASTLNLGAAFRRLREANLSTAEKIAAWTLFLKTLYQPDEMDAVTPLSTLDIEHGMMTALPNSVEPFQLRAEQPGPTYDTFHRSLLNEQSRPKSMPYNVAACDSSSYNYASGRLDHQTYYGSLDVDREDANDLVLDPLFEVWFNFAVMRYGWLGGNPEVITRGAREHVWDWPKHRVADIQAEASANETQLQSGQIGLHRLYSNAGMDAEDEAEKEAAYFGITVEEYKRRQLDSIYPPPKQEPGKGPLTDKATAMATLSRAGLLNGHANGVHVNGN